MNRKMGKYFRNRILIQLGIEWVLGPLKFQLMMTTVTRMETVFIMNVNNRYLAMRGRTSDVGGKIFDTSRRNTTSERRMLMPEEKNSHILEKYHTSFLLMLQQWRKLDNTIAWISFPILSHTCAPPSLVSFLFPTLPSRSAGAMQKGRVALPALWCIAA